MKKLILIGRSGAGKTTLTQALTGDNICYNKTQYVKLIENYIDTPGEYAESRIYGGALAVYAYDSDVVGLLQDATEPFSLFPPCIVPSANRPVIGIISKIDHTDARVDLAELWLKNAGCTTIFYVNSTTGEGIEAIIEYLK